MNSYRVSKYNPANRNAQGRYLPEEWTSILDIGNTFAGTTLTTGEYECVESAYVDVAIAFLSESGETSITVSYDPGEIVPPDLRSGHVIALEAARVVLKALLREEYWCRLKSANGAFVEVGYDYLMTFGGRADGENWKAIAVSRGLYVESKDGDA